MYYLLYFLIGAESSANIQHAAKKAASSDENDVLDQYNATHYLPHLSPAAEIEAENTLKNAGEDLTGIPLEQLYEDTRILQRKKIHDNPPLSVKELRAMFQWLKSVSFLSCLQLGWSSRSLC